MTETHPTLQKFGYPDTLVKNHEHWAVVLRPKQITLGSLVLISKSEQTEFSSLAPDAFAELCEVIQDIETSLKNFTGYDKINYLTLMMVDPQVHTHVIPRYDGHKEYAGTRFYDTGWPGPPDLGAVTECDDNTFKKILEDLKTIWP